MKMKIKKARLKEIIKEEFNFHEQNRVKEQESEPDELDAPLSLGEVAKDELQSVMIHAAMQHMKRMGHSKAKLVRFEYALEDAIVKGMIGLEVPSVEPFHGEINEKELSDAISEVMKEEFGK